MYRDFRVFLDICQYQSLAALKRRDSDKYNESKTMGVEHLALSSILGVVAR
jgi:hypothetical protein